MKQMTDETPPALSDEELVALLHADPQRGIAALYDRFGRLVFSVALRIVQDHGAAEEITQDVFLGCWRHIDAYQSRRGSMAAWLLAIAHNRAIDELRSRRGSEARRSTPYDELRHVAHGDLFENALLRDDVRRALADLPPAQREVIELIYWRGLTRREVAEQLELPLGTVHTRLRLGMEKLRTLLDHLPGDD